VGTAHRIFRETWWAMPTLHLCLAGATAPAQDKKLPAFPGADGAAAFVTGGRGGFVYHVTKLDESSSDNAKAPSATA
jgi:hypothetical protein